MRGHSTGWQWQAGKLVGSVYLYERWSRRHYGYTWNAEPLETDQFLFTLHPLDPSVVKEDGSIAPLAQSRPPGIVAAGSSFEVILYASGNERVFDRIELSRQPLPVASGKDSTQEALAVTLTNPKLYINGQFASGSNGVVEARGLTAYVELPGRGRYVLALASQGNLGCPGRFRQRKRDRVRTPAFGSGGAPSQFRQ